MNSKFDEKKVNSCLEKIINKNFNSTKYSIRKIVRSYKNFVYNIRFSYNSNYIIKLFTYPTQENRGEFEYNCFSMIKKELSNNFPVPEVLFYENTSDDIIFPYSIEKNIEGNDLVDINIKNLNTEYISSQLGELTGLLNSITFDKCGFFNSKVEINHSDEWMALIKDEYNLYKRKIKEKRFITGNLLKKIEKYFLLNVSLLDYENMDSRFIHNDLCSVNIKLKEMKSGFYSIVGIMDFESSMSGDPIKELCKIEWVLDDINSRKKTFYKNYKKYIFLPNNYKKIIEFYNLLCRFKHISLIEHFNKFSKKSSVVRQAKKTIMNIIE